MMNDDNNATDASDAGKALSALGASKGGTARAESLSPERRKEIARNAVAARWAKAGKEPVQRAMLDGTLKIGDVEFDCAVLDDAKRTRVVSESKFMDALGMYYSGWIAANREMDEEKASAVYPMYLAQKSIKSFVPEDLRRLLVNPIVFRTTRGGTSKGIRADLIPRILRVWLDARDHGGLGARQMAIARMADILTRALAEVGIVALVDEATGFQDLRDRDALARILEKFVAKELQPWVRTFPPEYYQQIYKLRGWKYDPTSQARTPFLGKITNDLVYARLAPGVLTEVKKLTPRLPSGRLKNKFFQHLTPDAGHPKLREHLASLVTLARLLDKGQWAQFKKMVDKTLPPQIDAPLFKDVEMDDSPPAT